MTVRRKFCACAGSDRPNHTGHDIEDLRGGDLRILGELQQLQVASDGGETVRAVRAIEVEDAAALNSASAYGRSNGGEFGHGQSFLQLGLQAVERIGVTANRSLRKNLLRRREQPGRPRRRASTPYDGLLLRLTLAAATILASSVARALASSISCCARRSASARRAAASLTRLRRLGFDALVGGHEFRSALYRPEPALLQFLGTFVQGSGDPGIHTDIVNHTGIANTMAERTGLRDAHSNTLSVDY